MGHHGIRIGALGIDGIGCRAASGADGRKQQGNIMSKRRDNKSMKPVSPKTAAKQADTAFPVEQEDIEEQQQAGKATAYPR